MIAYTVGMTDADNKNYVILYHHNEKEVLSMFNIIFTESKNFNFTEKKIWIKFEKVDAEVYCNSNCHNLSFNEISDILGEEKAKKIKGI